MRTQFLQNITPIQQNDRRIPIHLQERVEANLNELIDQKHIKKLDKLSKKKQFISSIVITVKQERTVKLALDSKKINEIIHKNKHQTQKIELSLDIIVQIIKGDDSQQTLFTILDLRYAFLQILIQTTEHSNFSLIRGKRQDDTNFRQDSTNSRTSRQNFKKPWTSN